MLTDGPDFLHWLSLQSHLHKDHIITPFNVSALAYAISGTECSLKSVNFPAGAAPQSRLLTFPPSASLNFPVTKTAHPVACTRLNKFVRHFDVTSGYTTEYKQARFEVTYFEI